MKNIFEIVEEILLSADKYQSEDNNLLKAKVYSDVMMMDEELLSLLLSNERIKDEFFTKVKDTLVFDKQKFAWLIESKEFLPDSYTRYSNKIGLTSNGNFISQKNDVVLDFPYKDCYLQGGQDKEDQKREEIFYHETIASDEVTRMLAPKVFTNAKRYTKEGVEENIEFKDDDNLIIKGNNLVALSSLLKRYEGKVKLIYIDPPYYFHTNKKEDTFAYNSNFKLSTWLVFMKNRLSIAKKLLSDDGAIFVQISDDGVGELHTLMKEIFNDSENNFLNKITVRTKSPSGFASVNAGVFETAEYIISFAKNKKKWTYNIQYTASLYDTNYKWIIQNKEEDHSKWKIEDINIIVANQHGFDSVRNARSKLGREVFNNLVGQYALENADNVFRLTAIGNDAGQKVVEAREKSRENRDIVFEVQREGQYTVYVYNGNEIAFYSKKVREIDGVLTPSMQLTNIWSDTPYEGIASEGGVTLKGGKKPEKLIQRIIELSTDPRDLVLDFHLGSGTTAAVAHKIGRQYIGVEQLDYGKNDCIIRLNNVINGDQSGISKIVNWQGGGSFVYCELLENSKELIDEIQNATDATITDIKEKIYRDERIVPYITRDELEAVDVEFEKLTLEEKKMALCALVDKNKLYVNLSDIDDKAYNISDKDRKFTESF
ncbi:DNA methyltransferase [Vagococcus acidifermentans]|uniref:Site-specific DNA-methyltransferase n=1 Tax=Vagococcus acidifermentans TaxID=564710 RepID=A0A430AZ45_9ENTE|nr:site-specific DNA-methyltransferase [Vagococcus acidifermentans]RSU13314.1 site-specific DNA-methyltransferase [Vagococcus acidifermentans]